jgi:hypothetical protein
MAIIFGTTIPDAIDVPYDNTTSGLAAEDVQAAIDEIGGDLANAASPGFTFGKASNVNADTFLLNENVVSSKAGRVVPVDGEIRVVYVACENAATFDVEILRRSGASFVLLATANVVAARTHTQTFAVAVSTGDEIAAKVVTGSARNVVVGVTIIGTA